MSAMEMQLTGGILLSAGLTLFVLSQILLNRWYRSYTAELEKNE